jgi:hypothetical protein
MMSDNPEFQLLFSEQSVDAVELLAQHLEYLEESIAIVKSENQMLREAKAMRERQEHKAALAEELIFSPARSAARRPRCNIVEDLEEANPENSVLLETDSHSPNQQSNDPKMKARIQHLNRIGKFYN